MTTTTQTETFTFRAQCLQPSRRTKLTTEYTDAIRNGQRTCPKALTATKFDDMPELSLIVTELLGHDADGSAWYYVRADGISQRFTVPASALVFA